MNIFQRTALAALLATLLLIFVGAIVRATGSGLGCPDWPKCWGSLWPPSSLEQVDFDKIDLEKFRHRDPDITRDKLAAEFNPTHVWIEYINRLTSLPVGLFTLATFVLGCGFFRRRPQVFFASLAALLLVGVNAVLGAVVVRSGLKPGVITLHMGMAIALLCVLVFAIHRGGDKRPRMETAGGRSGRGLWWFVLALFAATAAEGVMGSQVREVTDRLALEYADTARSQWHETLEAKPIYLVHRSFSWLILILAAAFFWQARSACGALAQPCRWTVAGIVAAQMGLGLLMAHVSVSPVVQVLHIGLSSVLVCALFWSMLGIREGMRSFSPP